ncbi:YwqJ-related putative deaminase [Streptomyces noursei]|uniref:YwqJ-related putative deaminase n=1 Tax=Streptomyces noursei TaxID=1971 RepID=UPI00081D19F5|nr:deaminase [Streptomyces noursei ATCC 11455]MCZ0992608.1 YwqJ-related putative deaminase [Streptomyces noursei]
MLIPGTASSLLVQGKVVSHTNLSGDGTPNLHPAVRSYFEAVPERLREPFLGYCAESALVSDQVWALDAERPGRPPITLQEAVLRQGGYGHAEFLQPAGHLGDRGRDGGSTSPEYRREAAGLLE